MGNWSLREGNGNPLQYSCLEETRLKQLSSSSSSNWSLCWPGGSDSKESTCNIRDLGSVPGLRRFPGEGNSYPLQYSGLENCCGQRSLEGYSPWDCKEKDLTAWPSTQPKPRKTEKKNKTKLRVTQVRMYLRQNLNSSNMALELRSVTARSHFLWLVNKWKHI